MMKLKATKKSLTELNLSAKKIGVFSLVAACAIGLAGCGSTPSSAFKIGKESVSINQIEDSVNQILKERRAQNINVTSLNLPSGASLTTEVIQTYLRSYLVKDVAAAQGITYTPAQYLKYKASFISQIGGAALLPAALAQHDVAQKDFDLVVQETYLLNALNAKASALKLPNTNGEAINAWVAAVLAKNPVVVNPKYGSWDPQTLNVTAPTGSDAVAPANK